MSFELPYWESPSCSQVDPELFFPDAGRNSPQALKVCQGCVCRLQCLKYALDHEIMFGIWGGLSANQRREILRYKRKVSDDAEKAS